MGKRGPKPKGKVSIRWSADLAYAIGLLVTDGCLSPNGRHIIFVSKDLEQIENYMHALGITNAISTTSSGYTENRAFRVQFSDVLFHGFLTEIGLMPNKTKVIGEVKIPRKYFFDFLRGHLDGDGSAYSYYDPRWKSSFLFYLTFVSASERHITWLRKTLEDLLGVRGHISKARTSSVYSLRYGKAEAVRIIRRMYVKPRKIHLSRKRLKIEAVLGMMGEKL